MRRHAVAIVMFFAVLPLFAGELAHKETYTAAAMKQQGIASVSELMASYARDQSLELKAPSPPLFLVNGIARELPSADRDRTLREAASVEVMSDGDAVVINVLR